MALEKEEIRITEQKNGQYKFTLVGKNGEKVIWGTGYNSPDNAHETIAELPRMIANAVVIFPPKKPKKKQ